MRFLALIRDRVALRTASRDTRGFVATLLGGTGVADKVYFGRKTSADAYEWQEIVGASAGQTITNVTIAGGAITKPTTITVDDDDFTLQDQVDNTKKAQFQLSGITAGNTRVITLPNANTTIRNTLTGSKTHDWADLASGAEQSTTVTVLIAALGDVALASMDVDLAGTKLIAYVSAANTVTVIHRNDTGSNVNLASGTLRAYVVDLT